MSLHLLEIEPRDVAADALGLLLDAPVPPTLVALDLTAGPGRTLQLGVLGASHVVCATADGARLTEQVSCDALAAGGERLPASKQRAGYHLSTCTDTLPATELGRLADTLRTAAEDGDRWVCGAFPGSGSALTALTGAAVGDSPLGGWTWQTWHLYPGRSAGVVVRTRSRWTR